ncbi:hypothetical protein ACFLWX_01760 [Chloroflexota bacterium]
MDKASLESQLKATYLSLIETAVQAGLTAFKLPSLPTTQATSMWLEPTAPGSHSSKKVTHEIQNLGLFWKTCRDQLESSPQWKGSRDTVEKYINLINAKPGGLWAGNTDLGYIEQTINLYLKRIGSFAVDSKIALEVVGELISHLNKDSTEISTLVALEGFSAPGPFQLGSTIMVRSILEQELYEFGLIDEGPVIPGFTRSGECPKSDWWICEIRVLNQKGTADGWNYTQGLGDKIRLGLHMFKEGKFSVIPLSITQSESIGRTMSGRGGLRTCSSPYGQGYSLSSEEVEGLTEFWPCFLSIMDQEDHYLQLAARRLDAGGGRQNLQDAIVDCVIGLESLLSRAHERTEIRYRFSVRGAVLLADDLSERPKLFKQLKDLYDFRSGIVHGTSPSAKALESTLCFAQEALRKCWKWYVQHWQGDTDNTKGIDQIDRLLFLTK